MLGSLYQQKHWTSAQVQNFGCFYQFLQQEAVDNIFSGLKKLSSTHVEENCNK